MSAKRLVGFMLLLAGWGLVLAAVGMLKSASPRAVFALMGVAVEVLGFVLTARSHLSASEEKK